MRLWQLRASTIHRLWCRRKLGTISGALLPFPTSKHYPSLPSASQALQSLPGWQHCHQGTLPFLILFLLQTSPGRLCQGLCTTVLTPVLPATLVGSVSLAGCCLLLSQRSAFARSETHPGLLLPRCQSCSSVQDGRTDVCVHISSASFPLAASVVKLSLARENCLTLVIWPWPLARQTMPHTSGSGMGWFPAEVRMLCFLMH